MEYLKRDNPEVVMTALGPRCPGCGHIGEPTVRSYATVVLYDCASCGYGLGETDKVAKR